MQLVQFGTQIRVELPRKTDEHFSRVARQRRTAKSGSPEQYLYPAIVSLAKGQTYLSTVFRATYPKQEHTARGYRSTGQLLITIDDGLADGENGKNPRITARLQLMLDQIFQELERIGLLPEGHTRLVLQKLLQPVSSQPD